MGVCCEIEVNKQNMLGMLNNSRFDDKSDSFVVKMKEEQQLFEGLEKLWENETDEDAQKCLDLIKKFPNKLIFPIYKNRVEDSNREFVSWENKGRHNPLHLPAWIQGEKLNGLWDGRVIYVNEKKSGITICHYEKG